MARRSSSVKLQRWPLAASPPGAARSWRRRSRPPPAADRARDGSRRCRCPRRGGARCAASTSSSSWKQRPAAELLDDQVIFGERAVLVRKRRLRHAEPALGQEPSCDRSVAEERDAARLTRHRHRCRRPVVQQRGTAPGGSRSARRPSDSASTCAVSKLVSPISRIFPAPASARVPSRPRLRAARRSPTSGTARGPAARRRAASATGRSRA